MYSVIFKHGFECCTRPDTVADIAIHGEAIEVHSFDDVQSAYCWCCRRTVARQIEQRNRRPPVFPRLSALQMDVAYFEPGYGPAETLPYARYFGAVSGDYAGVFTAVSNIREFLAEFEKGQIREFDDEEEEIKQISEDEFNIDGTSAISEVESLLDIELPEGEYDTIAGFFMSVLGKIPDIDEKPTIEYGGFSFTVTEMDERRIVRILVKRLPEPEKTDQDESEDKDV